MIMDCPFDEKAERALDREEEEKCSKLEKDAFYQRGAGLGWGYHRSNQSAYCIPSISAAQANCQQSTTSLQLPSSENSPIWIRSPY